MADKTKNTEEQTAEVATEKKEVTIPHKCLIRWRGDGMLNLYAGKGADGLGKFITIYPGWNTVDSGDVMAIYTGNRSMFDDEMVNGDPLIEFKGVQFKTDESGNVEMKEGYTIKKDTAAGLAKIIKATVNPDTLADLSSPQWTKFTGLADARIAEIQKYEGFTNPNDEE